MSQREADTRNEVEKEGPFHIINDNFCKIIDGFTWLAWVRILHEKVFHHVDYETDLHYSVKDGQKPVIRFAKARKVGAKHR